jgi:tetratricopeptide (TPR) repeat protein
MLREALRLSQLLKDKHTTAWCHLCLGRAATLQTNFEDAVRYLEEGLQILRYLSDRFCSTHTLFYLGWNAYLASEEGQAIHYFQESLSICREIDWLRGVLLPTFALGRIALSHGDIYKAKSYFLEALEAHKKSQDSPYFLAYCLEAVCAIPTFPPAKAARLLGRAEAIREKRGYVLAVPERHLVDPIIEKLRSQLGDEAFDSARVAGKALTDLQVVEDAIEVLQLIG